MLLASWEFILQHLLFFMRAPFCFESGQHSMGNRTYNWTSSWRLSCTGTSVLNFSFYKLKNKKISKLCAKKFSEKNKRENSPFEVYSFHIGDH